MGEKDTRKVFIRSVYEAAVEILGKSDSTQIFSAIVGWDGDNEVPEIKDKLKLLSDLVNEFAIRFQRNTAKGLLYRIGNSSFNYLRRNLEELLELGSIENRLKPISRRFDYSLGVLADSLSELTGLEIEAIKKSTNTFCLEISENKNDESFSSDLHLYYFSGLLHAFCEWMDSRKEYFVDVNENYESDTGGKLICFRYEETDP